MKRLLLTLALLATSACGPTYTQPHPITWRIATASELGATNKTNLFDALRTARPDILLQHAGLEVVVFLNYQRFGSVASLQNLPVEGVVQVRRLSPGDATILLGSTSEGATVIQVVTTPHW